jgi:hypothetical protein
VRPWPAGLEGASCEGGESTRANLVVSDRYRLMGADCVFDLHFAARRFGGLLLPFDFGRFTMFISFHGIYSKSASLYKRLSVNGI